jgi:metal-responsive CopG/Arc/MetJ family transcriptional regulator
MEKTKDIIQMNVPISEELLNKFDDYCMFKGRSRSAQIRRLMINAIIEYEKEMKEVNKILGV